MKVLNISIDKTILEPGSVSAGRMMLYAGVADIFDCAVAHSQDAAIQLAPNSTAYGSGGKTKLVRCLKLAGLAIRLARERRYDVITAQDPFETALAAWVAARISGAALNIQEHGDFFTWPYWFRESFWHMLKYPAGIFLVKRADSVRAVSRRISRALSGIAGIDSGRIVTVPVYFNNEAAEPVCVDLLRQKYPGKFIFLTIGRLVRQKNIGLLIRAFSLVHAQLENAVLVIVGEGPEQERLEFLAGALRIGNCVYFEPWTADVMSYYRSADAYVLASNYEGWGRVIVEAAVAGLPIIMTDVGCAGELITNEESGLIVPIGDKYALSEAMLRLAHDTELRARLAQAAGRALESLPDLETTLRLHKESWEMAARSHDRKSDQS